jgi:phosphate transport system permease protein
MPLVAGTFLTSAVALALAMPVGMLSAVYLSEYASPRVRAVLKPALELLAGVPTVVYGYFALLTVTPLLKRIIPDLETFNALSAGLTMGVMIIPLISSLSEDALYAVPSSLREAAYALGATRLEVAVRVVIPAALSGIAASFILAASRAVGETMIVAIAAGQRPTLTLDPRRAIETMTAYIVQVSLGDTPHGTLEFRTIFAVGLVLFLITLVLNLIAMRIIERYREVYR